MTSLYFTFRYPTPRSHLGCYCDSEGFHFRNFEKQYPPLWSQCIQNWTLSFLPGLVLLTFFPSSNNGNSFFLFGWTKNLEVILDSCSPSTSNLSWSPIGSNLEIHPECNYWPPLLPPPWSKSDFSHLDYYHNLLTGLPASTLETCKVYFQDSSHSNPLKVNQIMSLLCSEACSAFPFHSEANSVFTRVYKAYIFGPHYLSHILLLPPAHSTPHRPPCYSLKISSTCALQGFEVSVLPI